MSVLNLNSFTLHEKNSFKAILNGSVILINMYTITFYDYLSDVYTYL